MRKAFLVVLTAVLLLAPLTQAQNALTTATATDTISLPAPTTTGGMALTDALAKRRSTRAFTATALTQPEISQLFWAAQGITDDKGHRTAPSARAKYYLTLYVATADGLFQYLPEGHKLRKLNSTDLRSKLSPQPSVSAAPAVFIITGDYTRANDMPQAQRWVDLEAGHATQNLLLQATALNLAGVSAGGIDPAEIMKIASLPKSSEPIYLVPIGHAK
ncbi:MAG TPA: SagB/ThcOx family dehydrogenase [Candidatus Acidoferrales bacterium]|nr:SagB/ThcOx family dehydrogenase [Candidatus Acidoferrales bacterium]